MNFIPVIVYALTLGYGTPQNFALADDYGSMILQMPEHHIVTFQAEAQWSDTLYVGGASESTNGTVYDGGFTPIESAYTVWAGLFFRFPDFNMRFQVEHTCYHPQSSIIESKVTQLGFYGAEDKISLTFSTGDIKGR